MNDKGRGESPSPDWSKMAKYLALVSFFSVELGPVADGQEIELNAQQAKDLAAFVQPLGKSPRVETAEAEPEAENADARPVRRKRAAKE